VEAPRASRRRSFYNFFLRHQDAVDDSLTSPSVHRKSNYWQVPTHLPSFHSTQLPTTHHHPPTSPTSPFTILAICKYSLYIATARKASTLSHLCTTIWISVSINLTCLWLYLHQDAFHRNQFLCIPSYKLTFLTHQLLLAAISLSITIPNLSVYLTYLSVHTTFVLVRCATTNARH